MTDAELLLWLRLEDTNLTDFAADRIEALTDKLAKAVEALQWCAMYGDGDVALATLAEIKGESHE